MRTQALLALLAALILAPGAFADGGPDPGVLQAGGGISTRSGSVRFVTIQTGRVTTLEAIATAGGQVIRSTQIRGGWGVPFVDYSGTTGGLSQNGHTLVLAQSGYDGVCDQKGCTPLRRTTTFQLIDPQTLHRRASLSLHGDFAYDALSPDGKRLYLIQHTSTANTTKYVVRAYDLKRHRLLPGLIADRTQRGWIMQGIPMARATSQDGRYVYTLYANPGGYPFVHALDSVAGRAHCIGIPWTNEQSLGDLDLLTLSPNGYQLTIGTRTPTGSRMFFRVDTDSYRITPITPSRAGFPWWTLALLTLLAPISLLLARTRRTKRLPTWRNRGRPSKRPRASRTMSARTFPRARGSTANMTRTG